METATKIKLSKETMDILKNYSSINSNIFINSGNRISTISPIKNILSEVEVSETFVVGFGIWDLPKFLRSVRTMPGAGAWCFHGGGCYGLCGQSY